MSVEITHDDPVILAVLRHQVDKARLQFMEACNQYDREICEAFTRANKMVLVNSTKVVVNKKTEEPTESQEPKSDSSPKKKRISPEVSSENITPLKSRPKLPRTEEPTPLKSFSHPTKTNEHVKSFKEDKCVPNKARCSNIKKKKHTSKPNEPVTLLKGGPKMSSSERSRRKTFLKIIDFFNDHPKFKHLFEFIQEWSLKTSAGTVFVFQGPGKRPQREEDRERIIYRSIGIHLGLLKVIAATLAQHLDNTQSKFNEIGDEVDALLMFLTENKDDFLAEEHDDCLSRVDEFEDDIRQRFHLPILCKNFCDEILYIRVDTFWNIMIALGGKPIITLDNNQLAALAQQTKNKFDTHWTFNQMETRQISLFAPVHINLMEKLKPSYSFILGRNVQCFRMIKQVAEQDSDFADKIRVNSNMWRLEDKSGVNANTHWLSDQPVQSWHYLAKVFKDNDIEDENRNNDSEGEESGEESTFEGESADKSECAELMEFL